MNNIYSPSTLKTNFDAKSKLRNQKRDWSLYKATKDTQLAYRGKHLFREIML